MQRAVVLLVEDNPDDVIMVREAFEQSLTPVQLYVVSNGEQAIKFVRRTDAAAPRPSLILLDLNLPMRNGMEVLAEADLIMAVDGYPTLADLTRDSLRRTCHHD